ncbi:kynurenine formamidase isoform X1 [Python bivittatus]|uniref:Kynurenine formamidase isoform X1 n=1 Tax=Python bivittatus TaxID=176946 RepID=A0A9F5IN90_PYTBI|nr:kynurenine formamidase isoform X1 [Python bivittatus]
MGKWQEMTKEELETQYSPSRWSPRLDKDAVIEAHIKAVTEGTQNAQAFTQTLLNVPYGSGEGEKLDVYLPKKHVETFPLVLYIHGGYWQSLSKDVSGFAAHPLVNQGIALAAIGYDVAPKGQLEVMVEQVRRSVAFAVQQYTGISGVYLLGHSAGAHLAAMVLSTDWAKFGVEPDIKGAFLVSGIYDLEPITHTYVNDLLRMSWPAHLSKSASFSAPHYLNRVFSFFSAVARQNSPLWCVPKVKGNKACQILIAVAQHDSPEFRRQSQEHCQALRTAGWRVSLLDLGDTDHFDVIEKLSQENYLLTQVILNMISSG